MSVIADKDGAGCRGNYLRRQKRHATGIDDQRVEFQSRKEMNEARSQLLPVAGKRRKGLG